MATAKKETVISECLSLGIYKSADGRQLYEVAIEELIELLSEYGVTKYHSSISS
ncbi:Fur-regulated basic protein FbpA [Alteribacter natronophilus]|uniref:Fur-regulated basic protein FbpA n=1 Tax=Alteribacter natronophilus TaxID=2583810 RepID=UPI00110E78AD|nr:Fur-regulated basic protein FbpA [Alteribacter natronophilus]TMW72441.1 Fur-regulated basic protein FbpA [Alteribacter natronophilus]